MYCKQCGHRTDEKTEECPKCGAKFATVVELGPPPKHKVRWQVFLAAAAIGVIVFVVVSRVFLRTELETIGPTDRLRFLRAMGRSDDRRLGQREIRVEGQTLIVIWDLRWNVLPEKKQQQIVHNVGRVWQIVGGEKTQFGIEGQDDIVASYP
jgi:hypothetical protein